VGARRSGASLLRPPVGIRRLPEVEVCELNDSEGAIRPEPQWLLLLLLLRQQLRLLLQWLRLDWLVRWPWNRSDRLCVLVDTPQLAPFDLFRILPFMDLSSRNECPAS
jgi:hypothetical protein